MKMRNVIVIYKGKFIEGLPFDNVRDAYKELKYRATKDSKAVMYHNSKYYDISLNEVKTTERMFASITLPKLHTVNVSCFSAKVLARSQEEAETLAMQQLSATIDKDTNWEEVYDEQ
jgi:hypothetical protein